MIAHSFILGEEDMLNYVSPLNIHANKKPLLTKLIIAHQILNCIRCPLISRCNFTRDLSAMLIEGMVDIDALETLSACKLTNLVDILNIARRFDGQDFINRLLNLFIKKGARSNLRWNYLRRDLSLP